MRGQDGQTGSTFSYVDLEERIPVHHPLRKIRDFTVGNLKINRS